MIALRRWFRRLVGSHRKVRGISLDGDRRDACPTLLDAPARKSGLHGSGLAVLAPNYLRACLKTPERGCVVLDQPQQVLKFRRTGVFSPCCGWSSTKARSFFRKGPTGGNPCRNPAARRGVGF